jgi:YesN/AraC family two-component response regulator
MQTNLIIADDEYFIRQKIKKLVPYEELGISLLGECENGAEVIDLINNEPVDIILLDIRMPKLTGIDVAKYVYEHKPEVKIIILSGFNDFEYARTTFRYGVFDYLLKPVEPEALTSVLKACVSKLQEDRTYHQQFQKLYHYKKCMSLAEVLKGSLDVETLCLEYPEYKNVTYSLFAALYTLMECETDAKNLVCLYRNKGIDCEYYIESEHIFFIQFFLTEDTLESLCHYICKCFVRDTASVCYFTFSKLFLMGDSWQSFHQEALFSLGYRYFSTQPDLSGFLSRQTAPASLPELSGIRHNLTLIINASDVSGYKVFIEDLFHLLEEKKSYGYLSLVVTEVLQTFSIRFPASDTNAVKYWNDINALLEDEFQLASLRNTLLDYGLKYMDISKMVPSDLKLSKKISSYIQEHYMDADLTVAKLGEVFQLNVSYMGSIFKKTNQLSILQYLTHIRLEAARKLLLSEQYKVGEVAEIVGFTDVFYFSKRFKRMYGVSPKDFLAVSDEGDTSVTYPS